VTIGVLFGGPTPEHDISILTGLQALRELASTSPVVGMYWTKSGSFYSVAPQVEASSFLDGVPAGSNELRLQLGPDGGFYESGKRGRETKLDLRAIVLATHGGPGEDGTLQGALDLAGLCYTGPSAAGAALGMDKWAFGAVVAGAGLPTLPRALLTSSTTSLAFAGPYILKPRYGGSSIGIDVVADLTSAKARLGVNRHLAAGCVVEPYRADLWDLQIGLRTYPTLSLSAIEKPLRRQSGAEILNYQDKYVAGDGMVSAPRELPATLSDDTAATIRSIATTLSELVGARGVARVDFLANENELFVNEINTIPGSLAKYLFVEPVVSFGELLSDLVAEALERPTHHYGSLGADGSVLRSAGSIAAKLA